MYWCILPIKCNHRPPKPSLQQLKNKFHTERTECADNTGYNYKLKSIRKHPRLFTKLISRHVCLVPQTTLKECLYSLYGIVNFWDLVLQLVPLLRIQGDAYEFKQSIKLCLVLEYIILRGLSICRAAALETTSNIWQSRTSSLTMLKC